METNSGTGAEAAAMRAMRGLLESLESYDSTLDGNDVLSVAEAAVYFKSRGIETGRYREFFIDGWMAVERECEECESDIWGLPDGGGLEFAFPAALHRAAQWLEVGNFEQSLKRFASDIASKVMRYGVHDGWNPVDYLFRLCRSDKAIDNASESMALKLKAITTPEPLESITECIEREGHQWGGVAKTAATIILAINRLRLEQQYQEHLQTCAELLLRTQKYGAWNSIGRLGEYPCVEATAAAMHALSLAQPAGWKHATHPAREWLEHSQERDGFWLIDGCYRGPFELCYSTVLVLDALLLTEGMLQVTFSATTGTPFETAYPDDVHFLDGLSESLELFASTQGCKSSLPTGMTVLDGKASFFLPDWKNPRRQMRCCHMSVREMLPRATTLLQKHGVDPSPLFELITNQSLTTEMLSNALAAITDAKQSLPGGRFGRVLGENLVRAAVEGTHIEVLPQTKSETETKPSWNSELRELKFRGEIVRKIRNLAVNPIEILATFEELGWPTRIVTPLDESANLGEAVRTLNTNLKSIRFEADGTGEGIIWREKES